MPNGGKLLYKEKRPAISGVYCITCNLTGKKYVGSSINLNRRIKEHKNRNINFKKFKGQLHENYTVEILEQCTISNLLIRERFYIDLLKTAYPLGFNKKCPISKKFLNDSINSDINPKKVVRRHKHTPKKLEFRKGFANLNKMFVDFE